MRWPGWPSVIAGLLAGTVFYCVMAYLYPELPAQQRRAFGAGILLVIFAVVGVVILIADWFDGRRRNRPSAKNPTPKRRKR